MAAVLGRYARRGLRLAAWPVWGVAAAVCLVGYALMSGLTWVIEALDED